MLTQMSGYTRLKHIDNGGFSEIYTGFQEGINREVAIKVIQSDLAARPDFVERFKQEADIIARLEHPHIIPLYDYWYDSGGVYLVMRYVRGGCLANRLQGANLPIDDCVRLLEQIASALSYAHRHNVIHQDIKPENILLDEDGNAYLTDFGIARDLKNNVNLAIGPGNTLHASPKFVSPEQIRRKEITPRSDIYSLGILMFNALTGFPPFERDDTLLTLRDHIETPLPILQEKNLNLPLELNEPIRRATRKDPSQRYQEVLEFAQDFRKIVSKLQYARA